MKSTKRSHDLTIWALGLGYFVFYTPYSGLTKAVTAGLYPGLSRQVSGIQVLPVSVMATVIAVFSFVSLAGWWKFAGHRSLLGVRAPVPSRSTLVSGICSGVIIGATTLAFSFKGASIVFILILLRGGVLVIGPVVDTMLNRRVRWFSWAAMVVSLLAMAVALADVTNYKLSPAAIVDIAAYLAAYFVRFRLMTRLAKTGDSALARRYFAEEQLVATPFLLLSLGALALIGRGDIGIGLREGFLALDAAHAVIPAILIGLSYAALLVCTTFIFLDSRENTFCIPVHCGSSMLSGVVATSALALLYHQQQPSAAQYASTALLLFALLILSPLHHVKDWIAIAAAQGRVKMLILIAGGARRVLAASSTRIAQANQAALARYGSETMKTLRRVFLFVCSGNTCRSPMAAAIGNAEIAARLGIPFAELHSSPVRAISAGLSANPGASLSEEAAEALRELNVPVPPHRSRLLTTEMLDEAEVVFCMSASHRDAVLNMNPAAAVKTCCLDPDGDVQDPIGAPAEVYRRCATEIQNLVRWRLTELGIAT